MAKVKFVYADIKIAKYTENITTDITNAKSIGILEGGLKIEGDVKVTDFKPYGFSGKIFGRAEIETVKVTSKMAELNKDSIASTGLFTKTGEAGAEKYVLTNPNEQYLIIVEEKMKNGNDEKLRYVFYPCVFSAKLELDYNDKQLELPIEYTVYADTTDPEGKPGMYYEDIHA